MKKRAILFLLGLVNAQNICKLSKDLRYEFTECNQDTNTQNLFFYYPKENRCDMRSGRSDPVPEFQEDVSCAMSCGSDGMYSKVQIVNNKPKMVCE